MTVTKIVKHWALKYYKFDRNSLRLFCVAYLFHDKFLIFFHFSIFPLFNLQVSFISTSSVLLRAFLTDGRGGSLGGVCPTGSFCPGGTSLPVACSPGYYNSGMGGKDLSYCTACPPSFYCEGSGLSSVSGPCSAGYYCDLAASTPTQHVTQPGYYSFAKVRQYVRTYRWYYNYHSLLSSWEIPIVTLVCSHYFILHCWAFFCSAFLSSTRPWSLLIGYKNSQLEVKELWICGACEC